MQKMIFKTYKIVECEGEQIKALFHGTDGTRVFKQGEWLESDTRISRDGSGDNWYQSGWHTLPTLADAQDYMRRFRKRREKLRIVECEVKDTWLKQHSPRTVILSKWIKIGEIVA